jgi:hypothetical protein
MHAKLKINHKSLKDPDGSLEEIKLVNIESKKHDLQKVMGNHMAR